MYSTAGHPKHNCVEPEASLLIQRLRFALGNAALFGAFHHRDVSVAYRAAFTRENGIDACLDPHVVRNLTIVLFDIPQQFQKFGQKPEFCLYFLKCV
jgi:hypothetical protein